jgi:hypothetical protein
MRNLKQRSSRLLLGSACFLIMLLSSCGGNESITNWLNKPLNNSSSSSTDPTALPAFTKDPQSVGEYATDPGNGKNGDDPLPSDTIEIPTLTLTQIPLTEIQIEPSNTPRPNLLLDVIPITEDSYGRFNSLLVSHAMNKLDIVNNKKNGHFSTDLTLKKGVSYGLFAWCSSKDSRLKEILSKISYSMEVDGTDINTDQFEWIFHKDTNGNFCAVPGALVTNIQKGKYHIVITETIHSKFSEEIGQYETGDYIYDLSITFN